MYLAARRYDFIQEPKLQKERLFGFCWCGECTWRGGINTPRRLRSGKDEHKTKQSRALVKINELKPTRWSRKFRLCRAVPSCELGDHECACKKGNTTKRRRTVHSFPFVTEHYKKSNGGGRFEQMSLASKFHYRSVRCIKVRKTAM